MNRNEFCGVCSPGRPCVMHSNRDAACAPDCEIIFAVISLDGDYPVTIETGKFVEVFGTREEAESFINKNPSETRLEILPVRV